MLYAVRSEWAALLDAGDFPGARVAWEKTADRSLEASWDLAEIEERWGDAFFFAGEPGAAPHFEAARIALVPPGTQFSAREENDRRMEAYQRVTGKLSAVDPYDKPRPGHDGHPHPKSTFHPRSACSEPQPIKPSRSERLAAVRQSQEMRAKQQTEFADLFKGADHWAYHGFGDKWRDAGESLAAAYPQAARQAYAWSVYYFELYNRAWTAHLPASRWDSDGGLEIMRVQELGQSLAKNSPEQSPPRWVEAMLAGDWRAALSALGGTPAPIFQPMLVLLAEACRAAGREDEAGRVLHFSGTGPLS
jgi:hypothetical protein